jgi:hypothetical protein
MNSGETPSLPHVIWTSIANLLIASLLEEAGAWRTKRLEMVAAENIRPALFGEHHVFHVSRNHAAETADLVRELQWRLSQCWLGWDECDEAPTPVFPPAEDAEIDVANVRYFNEGLFVREHAWLARLRADLTEHVNGRLTQDYGVMLAPFCVVCKEKWMLQENLRFQLKGMLAQNQQATFVHFHELGAVLENDNHYWQELGKDDLSDYLYQVGHP